MSFDYRLIKFCQYIRVKCRFVSSDAYPTIAVAPLHTCSAPYAYGYPSWQFFEVFSGESDLNIEGCVYWSYNPRCYDH